MTISNSSVLSLAPLALFALAGCPDREDVPSNESCLNTSDPSAVSSIELGGANANALFSPWSDGQTVSLVFGSQGGAMIESRLRLRGTDLGGCFAQRTTVETSAGDVAAEVFTAVAAYGQSDGSHITDTLWLILDEPPASGATLTVTTDIGDVTATREIVVE